MATPPKGSVKSSSSNPASKNYSPSVRPSAAPAKQVKGPTVAPLPNKYPAGGTPIGNSAANKPVLDAWRASGGTTTSTYRDQYTNPLNPGESALQEAQRLQQQGAAAIFQRIQEKDNPGQAKPTVYTRTLADGVTKQNVLTGEVIPPEKKIIASPVMQTHEDTAVEVAQITRPYNTPAVTLDTYSLDNKLPPAKGTIQGAIDKNTGPGTGGYNIQQALKNLQAQTPMLQAMGLGNIAKTINQMVQQLGPGVQARISAKGAKWRSR